MASKPAKIRRVKGAPLKLNISSVMIRPFQRRHQSGYKKQANRFSGPLVIENQGRDLVTFKVMTSKVYGLKVSPRHGLIQPGESVQLVVYASGLSDKIRVVVLATQCDVNKYKNLAPCELEAFWRKLASKNEKNYTYVEVIAVDNLRLTDANGDIYEIPSGRSGERQEINNKEQVATANLNPLSHPDEDSYSDSNFSDTEIQSVAESAYSLIDLQGGSTNDPSNVPRSAVRQHAKVQKALSDSSRLHGKFRKIEKKAKDWASVLLILMFLIIASSIHSACTNTQVSIKLSRNADSWFNLANLL